MVSYYNALAYSQKHNATNLAYSTSQPWQWPANYHGHTNHQFLSEMDSSHTHHQMYYNTHMFHTSAGAASEWHSPSPIADNFSQNPGNSLHIVQLNTADSIANDIPSGSSININSNPNESTTANSTQIIKSSENIVNNMVNGLPSPPITVSGSEISSPGIPAPTSSPQHILHVNNNNNNSTTTSSSVSQNNLPSPVKAQYYDWMKKPTYPAQPAPGKTRTKDKYRVVYTDFQRLELEKEYCTSRYITIRRKTELAQALSLSERQVKIWFQNRRAKERKQNKKNNDTPSISGIVQHSEYPNLMQTKPKLEPGLHLQHTLHSMSSMAALSMPNMGLHHLSSHHPLAVTHQLHQSSHSQHSANVGSLSM